MPNKHTLLVYKLRDMIHKIKTYDRSFELMSIMFIYPVSNEVISTNRIKN